MGASRGMYALVQPWHRRWRDWLFPHPLIRVRLENSSVVHVEPIRDQALPDVTSLSKSLPAITTFNQTDRSVLLASMACSNGLNGDRLS